MEKMDRVAHRMTKNWKGDHLRFFNIHFAAKQEKIEENKKFYFREKISKPKKTERAKGTLWDFSTSILSQNIKKMQGGSFGEKYFSKKKVSQCRQKWKGDPLVSPGMVCYAEKQEKPFWFSSLGQRVQFGAIIFCRTFKNYFGQFVWIQKKVTIIHLLYFK